MQQNVKISIRGEQDFVDAGKDVAEFVTDGTLTETDYGWLLEYDESALTGMEGTHTAFQIREKTVALIRTGAFRSHMIFEQGKKHLSMYETPYGTMTLAIVTSRLSTAIGAEGGEMDIRYAIEIEHQVAGKNRFEIKVRRCGSPT